MVDDLAAFEKFPPPSPGGRLLPAAALAGLLLAAGLFLLSRANYLLYHGLIEFLSITVSLTIFSIGWHSRAFVRNGTFLVLSLAFLVVGVIDLLHTLAYKGMGVFPGYGPNLPTQLWVAARYVEGVSFLAAAAALGRPRWFRPGWLMAGFLLGGGLLIAVILPFGIFPDCFVQGRGLTPFKVASEYLVSGLFLAAGLLFWRRRQALSSRILRLLLAALLIKIGSELSFTLYADVYGFFNFLGHVFKLGATGCVYAALVLGSLRTPYESLFLELSRSEAELKNELAERLRAEERLRQLSQQHELILNTANEGIFGLDRQGRTIFVNPAAERILGWSAAELIGQDHHRIIHHSYPNGEHYPADRCPIHATLAGGRPHSGAEEAFWRKDGTCFPVEYSSAPIADSGEFTGAVISFRDITERKRVREELQRAKETAEAANRAKSEFLANMSHEIRTPMNAIIGMSELTLATPLRPEQREYLEMVLSSAEALLRVINDILDFSKIEAGRFELDEVDFNLAECVEKTVEALALRAHQKGLEIACQLTGDLPARVNGDPGRLRQVLINLVGNAIKFTEKGEVVVRVEPLPAEAEAEGRTWLGFSVTDTGIGIPGDKLHLLFQSFSQVSSGADRVFGGTGLGLAISRQIVEVMGGVIDVSSTPGKGSTFSFGLPLKVAPASAPPPIGSLGGLRALVVDDNDTNRRILKEMLTAWGMEPTLAAGSREALRLLAEAEGASGFDLLLLDSQMPEMDGFAVAEEIGRQSGRDRLVIMMVTSEEVAGAAARCRQLRIARYLVKPVKQSELHDAISEAMSGRGAAPSALLPPRAEEPEYPWQGRGLQVLLAEDNPINQKLATVLLRQKGCSVAPVTDGRSVLQALRAQRFDLVLMDIQMPDLDGLEATRLLRSEEREQGTYTPVIGLSAHAMKGDRELGLSAGMDEYVTKPIHAGRLFEAITRALAKGGAALPETPPVDLIRALEAVGGDRQFLTELADQVRSSCPEQLERLRGALSREDGVEVERLAHNLKSVVGIFGAQDACALAQQLEKLGEKGEWDAAGAALAALEEKIEEVLAALPGHSHAAEPKPAGKRPG